MHNDPLAALQFKQWHNAVNFGRALRGIDTVIRPQLQVPRTISVESILNRAKNDELLCSVRVDMEKFRGAGAP